MQTPQPIKDVDFLAAVLEGCAVRIQGAEIDPIDGLVVFNCEVLFPEKVEAIAAAFAKRELKVDAKTYSAILRDLHRRIRVARAASPGMPR